MQYDCAIKVFFSPSWTEKQCFLRRVLTGTNNKPWLHDATPVLQIDSDDCSDTALSLQQILHYKEKLL